MTTSIKRSPQFVWIAVVGLAIHITIGFIQPEWNTFRKVSPGNVAIVALTWILLGYKGWSLTH